MTDRIVLQGVSATGFHGVLDAEKRDGQPFVVDVTMHLDLSQAGRTDDLASTVNYATVAGFVVQRIKATPPFDLIERLAEAIADDVLTMPLVEHVEVTVHKPQAPVGHPFTDVAVTVERLNGPQVVIALGANLGEPAETLRAAMAEIAMLAPFSLTGASGLYSSDPVGGPDGQPEYVNAVVVGRWLSSPAALLQALHSIENNFGRTREVRWGARTLDLDIIQFGRPGTPHEVTSDDPVLTLPHPRAHERSFVLVPWLEADPTAVLRVSRQRWDGGIAPVHELLAGSELSPTRPL